jgi:type I restriction enzyme S subunit
VTKPTSSSDVWRSVRFGDVVRQVKRKVDPMKSGLRRYVAGEHMDTDDLRVRRWGSVGEGYLGPAFTAYFRPGQVLYGSRRTYLRKVAVADFEGVCANTTFVLEPSTPDLLPDFLPYIMTAERFHEHSVKQSKGSVNPYINYRDLTWYEFALPPVSEQRQIVRILASSDALLDEYQRANASARLFERTHFTEEVKSWGRRRLGDVADVSLGRQRAPKYAHAPGQTRYLRAANVKHGRFILDDVLSMAFNPDEVKRFELKPGDVVVTEGCGSIGEIGTNAVWEANLPRPICFQNTLIRLRSTTEKLDQRYLAHWASNAYTSGLFASIAAGTSILHLGVKRTSDLEIPVSTIDAQVRLVEQLESTGTLQSVLTSVFDGGRELRRALLGSLLGDKA